MHSGNVQQAVQQENGVFGRVPEDRDALPAGAALTARSLAVGDRGEPGGLEGHDLLAGKLPFVLEWMPVGCLLLDRDYLVTYWNRACESIFGFPKEEMIGRSPYETIVPASDRSHVEGVEAALRDGDAPIRGFNRNLTKDGRLIDCEWHNTAIRDANGCVSLFICMGLDITERIKSQEMLKRSEQVKQQLNGHLARTRQAMEEALQARIESESELLRNKLELKQVNSELQGILDAVEEGLVLYSRDLQIVWSNREACRLNRGSEARPEGGAVQGEAVPGYIRDCFLTARQYADQLTRSAGRVLDILVYPIFDEKGEVQSVLEVVRDVTRKTNQQAEALRTAHLASLGELAAGVAHEINNPIHGIMHYAELLIRQSGDERVADVSTRIIKESERVARIVRALLDFSRKNDGGKVRVRIEEVVDEALTLCHSQLKKDNIAVRLERENTHLLEVLADPQQIIQVLLNLISNARYSLNEKYPEPDGAKRMVLSLSRVDLDGNSFAQLALLDQGVGIPEPLLAKVLNPFFSTKPSGRGTGLGLSICNNIIADHGGVLEIASREGISTTVTLVLPVWRKHAG
jgi:two-component system, NtrC family, sensor kinase